MKPYYDDGKGIQIYLGDCRDVLPQLATGSVDLVLTSPPYDDLRTYGEYEFGFDAVAIELFRLLKDGGVAVWVVGDQTVEGSETLTSFSQAMKFKEIGFKVHDTMIYEKDGFRFPCPTRYHQVFEYMFVLAKGNIGTANLIADRPNINRAKNNTNLKRESDGSWSRRTGFIPKELGVRYNIWRYGVGNTKAPKMKLHMTIPQYFLE